MRRIYLDHAASTPLHPEALRAMRAWLDADPVGNPSSVHADGRNQEAVVSQARAAMARLLNARPPEVLFTASGTEAANLAVKGAAEQMRAAGKGDHIVTTRIEHECVLESCRALEQKGFRVSYLPVSLEGQIDPDLADAVITPGTILVTAMLANHEVGCLLPVRRLARRAHAVGALMHTDAAMAVGRMPVDVAALEVDLLSFSGHKMYAPAGTGGLFVRRGLKLVGQLHGGPQERKRRAGTENTIGLMGLNAAATALEEELRRGETMARLHQLTQNLWAGIQARVPGITLNTPLDVPFKVLPGILNLSFEDVEGESLLMSLDLAGVSVSSGAPCSSGSLDPSPVLLALELGESRARNSVRFSLGRSTSMQEIDNLLELLPSLVTRLRGLVRRVR